MHKAAAIKPVVIDESLVDLESLELAREQGYSGVALKACKGHTEMLLTGRRAQKYGMFLCVQDLSCPGFSFCHSASIAARLPTIAAIEGNSRQYCPSGNTFWGKSTPACSTFTTARSPPANSPALAWGFSWPPASSVCLLLLHVVTSSPLKLPWLPADEAVSAVLQAAFVQRRLGTVRRGVDQAANGGVMLVWGLKHAYPCASGTVAVVSRCAG